MIVRWKRDNARSNDESYRSLIVNRHARARPSPLRAEGIQVASTHGEGDSVTEG